MSSSHHNNADAKTCQIGGDIMLVLDTSDSMNQPTQNGGQSKLQAAVAAAKTFVNIVASYNNNNRIGLVTFDVTAQVKQTLTTNYSSVLNALNVLGSTEYRTCTQCGIDSTNTTFQNNPRAGVNKIAVMLTDGLANWCSGWPLSNSLDSTKGQVCALQSAQNAYATTGTNYFTIGLGQNVNSSFLQQIVSDTGGVGQYYFSPTTNQLQQIYTKISKSCLPSPPPISPTPGGPTSTPVPTPSSFSISGNVYVDTNGDQTYTTPPDNSYTSGTSTIYIYNHSTGALVKKLSTTNGAYTSGNILAAGTYDVKYTPLAPGYYVSYPLTTSPPSYTVTTGVNCDPGNYNDVTCINGIGGR